MERQFSKPKKLNFYQWLNAWFSISNILGKRTDSDTLMDQVNYLFRKKKEFWMA